MASLSPPFKRVALILAAGYGKRVVSAERSPPKQYKEIAGLPLLCFPLRSFLFHKEIHRVRVIIRPQDQFLYQNAIDKARNVWTNFKWQKYLMDPVIGGERRQDSVRAGLESLLSSPPDQVLIHDGVRPIITHEEINACIEALSDSPAVIPVLPLTDALKQYDDSGRLHHSPRESYRLALTPQGFDFTAILRAHRTFTRENFPDDATLAERAGLQVKAISGKPSNFKVTYAEDLLRAQSILAPHSSPGTSGMRIGWGYDVHPFIAGKNVRLCGVDIPHGKRLTGISDADVGLHALTDAILGAIAAGDIGEHFPPTDPRWYEADSSVFLTHAAELARHAGFCVHHVDVTLICESPKIAPHRLAMRQCVAHILALEIDNVSIKSTTTEGLGFLGREEGIAAHAIASLSPCDMR